MKSMRAVFLLIFLGCVGLLSYAMYLQLIKNLLPCPLCVIQRVAYCLAGTAALMAFLQGPQAFGRKVYSGLILIASVAGAAVALRQAWLVRYPEAFECGVSPEEAFLNALPLARWWPIMFEANGDCADATWVFMGLTLPDWSAIFFILFGGLATYAMAVRRSRR
ncbi:MAG TPA: disulfide bond formation protein B [Nitrosospira sp.]